MRTYIAGQVVDITATFASTTGAVDPSVVTMTYEITTGVNSGVIVSGPTTLTYSSASTPTLNQIARTGVGTYVARLDTTSLAGAWLLQWKSVGVGQTVGTDGFVVVPPTF